MIRYPKLLRGGLAGPVNQGGSVRAWRDRRMILMHSLELLSAGRRAREALAPLQSPRLTGGYRAGPH